MSFDRLAPFYRAMECVLAGNKLHRCRLAWVDEAPASIKRILLAGEGHGRFLEVCARKFPHARITCVDASAVMLRVAEARWRVDGSAGFVEFVHATLPAWAARPGEFDLIVTQFFLDCFPPSELADVVASLARAATPGAHWLLADFAVPERGWQRGRARLILWLAYAFFRKAANLSASELTSPDSLLERAGFRRARGRVTEWGLLRSELWVR